jgi:hypothetical protein
VKISLIFNKTHALDWIIIQYIIEIVFKTAAFRLFLQIYMQYTRIQLFALDEERRNCLSCFNKLTSYLIVSNMHMHSTPRQLFALKGELCISFKKINWNNYALDNYTIYATTCFSFISAFNFDVKISLIFNKTHAFDWIIIQYMIEIVFKTAVFRLFLRVILICHTSMNIYYSYFYEVKKEELLYHLKKVTCYLIVSNIYAIYTYTAICTCIACFEILQSESSLNLKILFT